MSFYDFALHVLAAWSGTSLAFLVMALLYSKFDL
jgi:hypothetical protein